LGWIRNLDALEKLKNSDELLDILSALVKSGSSELICWDAASTIQSIGFSFLDISRYLPEEPYKTNENIVDLMIGTLFDYEKSQSDSKISNRIGLEKYTNFWIYGPTFHLRTATSRFQRENAKKFISIIEIIVRSQGFHGIRETNKLLKRAEDKDFSQNVFQGSCENELFESLTQELSSELLESIEP
jgi:hypothetical protein